MFQIFYKKYEVALVLIVTLSILSCGEGGGGPAAMRSPLPTKTVTTSPAPLTPTTSDELANQSNERIFITNDESSLQGRVRIMHQEIPIVPVDTRSQAISATNVQHPPQRHSTGTDS